MAWKIAMPVPASVRQPMARARFKSAVSAGK
jgi:hypothetical protein